jgi:plastocyanin
MSGDLPKAIVPAAVLVVIIASVLLGIVIGLNLKTNSPSGTAQYADVTLVVKGNLALGPDNQTHDTFIPCNFTVYTGETVNLTIVNYDNMPHSFTSPTLNVDFQASESQATGVPSVSHFQFTETKAGNYRWWCTVPCDNDSGGWAMANGSDGQPGQIGYMGGFVTVLQG